MQSQDFVRLNQATASAVEDAFGDLVANFAQSRFLSQRNFLQSDTAKILSKQFTKTPAKRKKFLSKYTLEYVAASSLLHNIDAYNYFGHGISSMLRGDEHIATHLFYYAELRAAMALLATQGVGIFNDRHVSINKKSKAKLINQVVPGSGGSRRIDNQIGTHDFTWKAFENFISIDTNIIKLFDAYQVEGYSFTYWLEKFNVNVSFRLAIIKDFLAKLSFDLSHFSVDRNARNDVSYRPSRINSPWPSDLVNNLKDVIRIWNLSEPNNRKGEITLDYILLAELLHIAFKETHPSNFSFNRAHRQYEKRVLRMLNDLGIPENRRKDLLAIFSEDNSDLYKYLSLTDFHHRSFGKGILFRSCLFLRLSNVLCNNLLKQQPTIDKDGLEFWWKPIGIDFGLWESTNEPDKFADLWQDFEDSKPQIEAVLSSVPSASINSFWKGSGDLGFLLGTCPRIGFWGLGI